MPRLDGRKAPACLAGVVGLIVFLFYLAATRKVDPQYYSSIRAPPQPSLRTPPRVEHIAVARDLDPLLLPGDEFMAKQQPETKPDAEDLL